MLCSKLVGYDAIHGSGLNLMGTIVYSEHIALGQPHACHPGGHGLDGRTSASVHHSWPAVRRSPWGRYAVFHGDNRPDA